MDTERCDFELEFTREGLKNEEDAISTIITLISEVGEIAYGDHGPTKKGYGFTFKSNCGSFKDGSKCRGECLKESLKRAKLEDKVKVTGSCLQEKK